MKDPQPHLLPECFGDTLLVNILADAEANHQRSISQVFVTLKGAKSKKRAIGIIDADRRMDAYYYEFAIEKETEYFKYLAHPNKLHYLIVLKKDLEDLLMKCGKLTGLNHKLLNTRSRLKDATKSVNAGSNGDLKNLIDTLLQKRAGPLIDIQKILKEHKNKY